MHEISAGQSSAHQEIRSSLHGSYSFMGDNRHANRLGGSQENLGDILQVLKVCISKQGHIPT